MLNRALSLFMIGLIFGGGIGFTVAAGNGVTFDSHDHSNPAHQGDSMHHGDHSLHGSADHAMMHGNPVDVPAAGAPQVSITVTPDPMAGYNLYVMTQNFAFSPQNASLGHVPGEGHAHVYVNDEKLGRLYGAWMHLDNLPSGEVEVEVTLNTNDHRQLTVNGTAISASQTITLE